MADRNAKVIEQFRSGGEVEGMHRDRLVLLTTRGRTSHRPRTTPMMFLTHGRDIVVVASANAAPEHPHWYRNLAADPLVHVEAPDAEYDAVAQVLSGAERAEAWQSILERAPFFADHQDRVDREIPVVLLQRVGAFAS